jgi:hypothetical protein
MTTRSVKGRTRPAANEGKVKKLALSKKTLQDLTPGRAKGTAVRGGANTNSCGCI